MLETVIQGGLVIMPQGPCQADLGIGADGRIHALALPGTLSGKHVVSAEGLIVLPGGVDPHVHINMRFSEIQKKRLSNSLSRALAKQRSTRLNGDTVRQVARRWLITIFTPSLYATALANRWASWAS